MITLVFPGGPISELLLTQGSEALSGSPPLREQNKSICDQQRFVEVVSFRLSRGHN